MRERGGNVANVCIYVYLLASVYVTKKMFCAVQCVKNKIVQNQQIAIICDIKISSKRLYLVVLCKEPWKICVAMQPSNSDTCESTRLMSART